MPRRGSEPPGGSGAGDATRIERRERRRATRRQAILAAARKVLVEQGIAALTIAEVARTAGVSKPAVFYYFGSREEIVGGLAVELLEGEVALLERAIDEAPSGVEALAALVRAKVDRYADDLDAFRIAYVHPQLVELPPDLLQRHVYPLSQRINARLERRLLADREAGALHPSLHPRRLANLAWITAHGILSLAASLEMAGGSTAATLAQLRDEACALMRRAATAP